MESGIKFKSMNEKTKAIDKFSKVSDSQELAWWAKTCETTARKLCNDRLSDIILRSKGKELDIAVKDKKLADCLVKAIENNLSLMPFFVQGVFTNLVRDLKQATFNS